MGDPASEEANRFQLLRLTNLHFELSAFCDVLKDDKDADNLFLLIAIGHLDRVNPSLLLRAELVWLL